MKIPNPHRSGGSRWLRRWLGLLVVGSSVVGWRCYLDLSARRQERDQLQTTLGALDRKRDALTAEEPVLRDELRDRTAALAAAEAALTPGQRRTRDLQRKIEELREAWRIAPPQPPRRTSPSSSHGQMFAELIGDPVYAEHIRALWRPGIETRYAAFFDAAAISPEVAEKVSLLLIDRIISELDAEDVAERQGINIVTEREKVWAIRMSMNKKIAGEIRTTLGEAAFGQFQRYEATLLQRDAVASFVQRLSYSANPLSTHQVNQLVTLLSENQEAKQGRASPARSFNEAVMTKAQAVPTPAQWDALKRYRAEEEEQTSRKS